MDEGKEQKREEGMGGGEGSEYNPDSHVWPTYTDLVILILYFFFKFPPPRVSGNSNDHFELPLVQQETFFSIKSWLKNYPIRNSIVQYLSVNVSHPFLCNRLAYFFLKLKISVVLNQIRTDISQLISPSSNVMDIWEGWALLQVSLVLSRHGSDVRCGI